MNREEELEHFMKEYQIQITKKKKKKLLEMSQMSYYIFQIGVEIAHCCKELNLEKAYSSYQRSKSLQLTLTTPIMTNLLSLASGLGEIGSGNVHTHRIIPPPHDLQKALEIFSDMKNQKILINEAAFSSIIRCCCSSSSSANEKDSLQSALDIYEEMKRREVMPRLRTMTSLLQAFSSEIREPQIPVISEKPDPPDDQSKNESFNYQERYEICCRLFQEGFEQFHILFNEKEYYYLLRICYYHHQSTSFLYYLDLLMEELMVLSNQETMDLIQQFFQKSSFEYEVRESLIHPDGTIDINQEKLQSIDLTKEIQEELLTKIRSFAINRDPNQKYKLNNKIKDSLSFQNKVPNTVPTDPTAPATTQHSVKELPLKSSTRASIGKLENQTPEDRLETWKQFESLLAKKHQQALHENKKLIILDGANIGYYKQNYRGAPLYVNYSQINDLIEKIIQSEPLYSPLLILHARHLHPPIDPKKSPDEYQRVHSILKSWKDYLYATPKGFNDDWFWMFATIQYQCYIITNDDMRDHHFQLLSPRYFLRWKERHRVTYEITHYCQYNEMKHQNEFFIANIRFHWPTSYSHRIQYVISENYEGYYFPPLQKPVLYKEKDANKDNEEEDNESNSVMEGEECEKTEADITDHNGHASEAITEPATVERIETKNQSWFCIYRARASKEEEIHARKRGRSVAQPEAEENNVTEECDSNLLAARKNSQNHQEHENGKEDATSSQQFKFMRK